MDHLGFPASSGRSLAAEIQGQSADILYNRQNEPKLTWTLHSDRSTTHTIEADRIIGIIPVSPQLPDDHVLLYVDITTASATDHAEEHTQFRSVQLARPPVELLKDFVPSGKSCWQLRAAITADALTPNPPQSIPPTPPLHIILSVASGHRHAEATFNNLLKPYLDQIGCYDHIVHKTTSPQTIKDLTRSLFLPAANAGIAKFIVLLSGDGGIADLINGLLDSEVPRSERYVKPSVALLPLGTGNALAHSSLLTGDRTLGMSALVRGFPTPLPVFTVRFSPPAMPINSPPSTSPSSSFSPSSYPSNNASARPASPTPAVKETHGAVLTSWALHASLVADSDTPAARALGPSRFQEAARANLSPPHVYQGRVSVLHRSRDEVKRNRREWTSLPTTEQHSYVLATLCSRLESTFTVSPDSRPLDGKLRIVHVGALNPQTQTQDQRHATEKIDTEPAVMSGEKLGEIIMLGYQSGAHVQRPEVLYEEVDGMRIEMKEEDIEGDERDEDKGGDARWRRICVDGKIYKVEKGGVVEVWAPGVHPDFAGEGGGSGREIEKGAGVVDLVYLPR